MDFDLDRFRPITGDGLVDLLTESPISHIRLYKNTGTTSAPAFTDALKEWCDGRRHLIEPAREAESWRALLDELL